MSDVYDVLERIKQQIPPVNGNHDDIDRVKRFLKDTLNIYRILKTEYNGYPVMEDVTEEIKRFEKKWGKNGTHS